MRLLKPKATLTRNEQRLSHTEKKSYPKTLKTTKAKKTISCKKQKRVKK